jgi:hypothetical protein
MTHHMLAGLLLGCALALSAQAAPITYFGITGVTSGSPPTPEAARGELRGRGRHGGGAELRGRCPGPVPGSFSVGAVGVSASRR